MDRLIRKYFTCANSSQGFVNLFPSTLNQMDRVYILKGGPGTGKSTLMKTVGAHFAQKGETVDYIYCSSDTGSLDGVALQGSRTAIVDGTAPHVIEPKAPGAMEEYLSLGGAWDSGALRAQKSQILSLQAQMADRYAQIYRLLQDAKEVHDQWEKIYIANTDFEALDAYTQALTEQLLQGASPSGQVPSSVHRFFGAMTPEGSVNHIENLTQDLAARYFIKGRPGTGKSTMLKKLALAAQNAGLDTEVYHCSFDPDSLDMVIIRALRIGVFDSTAPHELFPSRNSDVILDVYAEAVRPGTDQENAETLARIQEEYESRTAEARALLGEIRQLHDRLEEIYIQAVDFSMVEQITQELLETLEAAQ